MTIFIGTNCYNKKKIIKEDKKEESFGQMLENIEIVNDYIKNRYILIDGQVLKIGKNIKEIDNDYYDIKIEAGDSLNIWFNKLFKDIKTDTNLDIEYYNEILGLIEKIFKIKDDNFKKTIQNTYVALRNPKNIDEISNKIKLDNMKLDKKEVSFKIEKNMLLVTIERRDNHEKKN
ncbi:MAG: hypothetical protein RSA08_04385 [Clostridia bacterium]